MIPLALLVLPPSHRFPQWAISAGFEGRTSCQVVTGPRWQHLVNSSCSEPIKLPVKASASCMRPFPLNWIELKFSCPFSCLLLDQSKAPYFLFFSLISTGHPWCTCHVHRQETQSSLRFSSFRDHRGSDWLKVVIKVMERGIGSNHPSPGGHDLFFSIVPGT